MDWSDDPFPDQLLIYYREKLIATHVRCYDRHQDVHDPDHGQELLIYLTKLIEGEFQEQRQRAIERRVQAARFPVMKTLEQFRWDWPKKINRLQVQHLFSLDFLAQKANVIFLGTVGLGKSHLATALGYTDCLEGHSVLFANAISVINDLSDAQQRGNLNRERQKYLRP